MEIRAGRKLPNYVIGFELWWRGFAVPATDGRRYLQRVLDKNTAELLARADPYEVADEFERTLERGGPRTGLYTTLLSRVGGDQAALVTGIYAVILFALGIEPVWESTGSVAEAGDEDEVSPRDVLAGLMGFDRAAADALPGSEPLISEPFDARSFLEQLPFETMFRAGGLSGPVLRSSDSELAIAPDDAHVFADLFPEFAKMVESAYGDDFAGFGIFTLERREQDERFFRAATVAVMLVLRPIFPEGIDTIDTTLRERIGEARRYNALVDAFPKYAPYLKTDQSERLKDLTPEFREQMRRDITTFLEAHHAQIPINR